jgi:hypothetical protein
MKTKKENKEEHDSCFVLFTTYVILSIVTRNAATTFLYFFPFSPGFFFRATREE